MILIYLIHVPFRLVIRCSSHTTIRNESAAYIDTVTSSLSARNAKTIDGSYHGEYVARFSFESISGRLNTCWSMTSGLCRVRKEVSIREDHVHFVELL